jgi:2-amino-4-hydroxy-6-hydroxymethyldihydropteridine diphosphokinase
MSTRPERVYVGVGSNLDPERNVWAAFCRLRDVLAVDRVATCYWSAPVGRPEQPRYLNTVWSGRYRGTPLTLRAALRDVEAALGRRRTADRYASRTVDLDVLLFGALVLRDGPVLLPDPDLCQRAFIALPLLEIDPELRLPDTGERLADRVRELDRGGLQVAAALTARLARVLATGAIDATDATDATPPDRQEPP